MPNLYTRFNSEIANEKEKRELGGTRPVMHSLQDEEESEAIFHVIDMKNAYSLITCPLSSPKFLNPPVNSMKLPSSTFFQ